MKTKQRGYYYTQKVGGHEFLVRVQYMPLFIIIKRARVGVTLKPSNLSTESLERSVIVNHSKINFVINKLIRNYLIEVGFFRIA
jgi:hypothetical protein